MDLALLNRIDNDLQHYFVVEDKATDEPHLDIVLRSLKNAAAPVPLNKAVAEIYANSEEIYQAAINQLVRKNVLAVQDLTYLWLIKARKYPVRNLVSQNKAKQKIFGILAADAIPDPRDVALVSLAYETDVLRLFLSNREVTRISERVHQISQLDLTAQATRKLSDMINAQIAALSASQPH